MQPSYGNTHCCCLGSYTLGAVRRATLEEPAAVNLYGGVCEVDQNGERLVHPLACILLYGAERQDGSSAHLERHGFEVNLTGDFAPPLDALTCPEIVPEASRKIDLARGCTLLNHRRH